MSNVQITPSNPRMSTALIGGNQKTIVSFDLNNDTSSQSVEYGRIHHIHILDRSGSMSSHIDQLMEDVKRTLRMIPKDDYVTIIWFSGAGQYRAVLKGSKNEVDSIDKILDSLKSTIGCTCFSDPLSELSNVIDETIPLCDVFNVTIFTDGEPVTPWSVSEEISMIFDNLNKIKDKVLAINTIGYGRYYNRDLLMKISEVSEYGQMAHASKIEDYSKIFSHNKESVEKLISKRVKIISDDCDIIVRGPMSIKSYENKATIRLAKSGNTVTLICEGIKDSVSFIIDGVAYNYKFADYSMNNVPVERFYEYAYSLYYKDFRKKSLEVLNYVGDKTLMDKLYNSFTVEEVGGFSSYFKEFVIKGTNNPHDLVESNTYTPDKDAVCVMDILSELVNSKAKYIPREYNRIGVKVVDEFNLFTSDDDSSCDISNLVFNKDKLNVSIKFSVNGTVKINPKQAKIVNLPETVPAKIFRTHTIIKDGSINVKTIEVLVDNIDDIRVKTALDKYLISDNHYVINLDEFPLINQSYTDANIDTIYDLESRINSVEVSQKVINYLIDKKSPESTEGTPEYTPDQWAILEQHGLNKSMTYSSMNPTKQESVDYYVAREFKTYISGFSSLPSIDKVLTKIKDNKKLSPSEEAISQSYKIYKELSYEDLCNIRNANKSVLNINRKNVCANKLGMILTGQWFSGLTPNEKGEYVYKNLVIKLNRVEVPV